MASLSVIIFSSIGAFLLFLLFYYLCCKCCRRKNGVNNRRNQSSGIPSFTGVSIDVPHSYQNGYGRQTNVRNFSPSYGQTQTYPSNQITNYDFLAQSQWNTIRSTNISSEPNIYNLATNSYTSPNSNIDSIGPLINQRTAPIHLNVSPKLSANRKLKTQPRKALSTRDQNIEHPIPSSSRTSRKRKPKYIERHYVIDNDLLDKHRTKLRQLPKRKKIEDSICLKSFELIDEQGQLHYNITIAYLNNFHKLSDGKTNWSKVFPGRISNPRDYIGAIRLMAQHLRTISNPNQIQEIISLVDQLIRVRVSELDKSSESYHGHKLIVRKWKKFRKVIST